MAAENRPARRPIPLGHVVCVAAPAQWLATADGDCRGGVAGLWVADRRALSGVELTLDGEPPVPLGHGLVGPDGATFRAAVAPPGEGADPYVACSRHRTVTPGGARERIVVDNRGRQPARPVVRLRLRADLAVLADVRAGRGAEPLPPVPGPDGLTWRSGDGISVEVAAAPSPRVDADGVLEWRLDLPAGGRAELDLRVSVSGAAAARPGGFRPLAPAGPAPWAERPLRLRAPDHRLGALVGRGVDDLAGLLLADPADPEDHYLAAGCPWYLTLFGRDSLWSALMALPLGVRTLAGTLRTLARRQGRAVDPRTEEAPGRIPHELRPDDAVGWLPPVYYGTVDATPLFVVALAEGRRWGMPDDQVRALLPHAVRALEWVRGPGLVDGFLAYATTGAGLVNQGWKDSADAVQWADGRLADGPVALCEVQGYAHRAALDGADLIDAYGLPGADGWREWAAGLADRFRAAYWVDDPAGAYPAIALDGSRRPVDGPASNMGHLLGTGLLAPAEEELVAARLRDEAMTSGYGLRTLAATAAGFNPLSYHGGSVWPHDTAITALGLSRTGRGVQAAALLGQLVEAAPHVGYRLPELYGGYRREGDLPPAAYPASCHPQAWAAAVGPLLVRVLLGLEVDVPAGWVRLRPVPGTGPFSVAGVRLPGGELAVTVDAAAAVRVDAAPDGLTVRLD